MAILQVEGTINNNKSRYIMEQSIWIKAIKARVGYTIRETISSVTICYTA